MPFTELDAHRVTRKSFSPTALAADIKIGKCVFCYFYKRSVDFGDEREGLITFCAS